MSQAPDDPASGGDSGLITWSLIAGIPGPIRKLASSPVAFILGAVLSALLTGVESALEEILVALRFVFVGDSVTSTDGALGIADIPLLAAEILVEPFDSVGQSLLDVADSVVSALTATAGAFGWFSPVVLAAEVAVVLAVSYVVMRTLLKIALDAIPGGGGLI